MARITIEDCTEKVPNRFHLVKMASIRTKQLKKGAQSLVDAEENKEVVLSLREIAAGFVKPDYPDSSAADSPTGHEIRMFADADADSDASPGADASAEADPTA
jgi:DNA-directed RNA polymerase subunit omega